MSKWLLFFELEIVEGMTELGMVKIRNYNNKIWAKLTGMEIVSRRDSFVSKLMIFWGGDVQLLIYFCFVIVGR